MGHVEGLCATPECPEPSGHGRTGLFCFDHASLLAQCAEDIKRQGRNMHNGAMTPKAKNNPKKRGQPPTCCLMGCNEPRIPPSNFCHLHEGEEEAD